MGCGVGCGTESERPEDLQVPGFTSSIRIIIKKN